MKIIEAKYGLSVNREQITIGAIDVGAPHNIGWAILSGGEVEHGNDLDEFIVRFAIDLDGNIINICRVQERDGTTTDTTKTEAGEREIPISATLRTMLLEWRLRCPRLNGELYRVFPGPGVQRQWPLPRLGGGGPILYSNFLKRYWKPAFTKAGVRYVTHHSARHSFVSVLQAQGVEVGLVAKLAGHSNPAVTLGHYTQAVRGGAEALAMLDRAYQGK